MNDPSATPQRPALIVVDMMVAFTDPRSPYACDAAIAVAAVARLLTAWRRLSLPVVFTRVEYDAAARVAAAPFIEKAPALADFVPDSPNVAIDGAVTPAPEEAVFVKLFPSAFFGTTLATHLQTQRSDAVVVCGTSTSGCVRATVVDALQHGYRVFVPKDAVADRAAGPHAAALFDIQAKYGYVVSVDEALVLAGAGPSAVT